MSHSKIVLLGTGGTIAGTALHALDHTGYNAAQINVQQLLASLPPLHGLGSDPDRFIVEQVAQIDSKDMGVAVWLHLAQRVAHFLSRPDVKGIVITHGTDTLEETAFFLHLLLGPGKPVVLTCAMRPSTALVPDGPQNLMDALAVASAAEARGVSVVCAGSIFSAEDVQKVHPYRLDAFSAGDAGPIGYVEEGRLRLLRHWPQVLPDSIDLLAQATLQPWPRVEIVMSHAGADGAAATALVKAGAKGLVVAATGNGSVHQDLHKTLVALMAQGVKVLRATRCYEGRLLPGVNDVLPAAPGLTPVKARIALILELIRDEAMCTNQGVVAA